MTKFWIAVIDLVEIAIPTFRAFIKITDGLLPLAPYIITAVGIVATTEKYKRYSKSEGLYTPPEQPMPILQPGKQPQIIENLNVLPGPSPTVS